MGNYEKNIRDTKMNRKAVKGVLFIIAVETHALQVYIYGGKKLPVPYLQGRTYDFAGGDAHFWLAPPPH